MEEEEAIKRITRLLEMGGTMLATHHDCGAPLFRYKGDVVCPVCSFEEAGASKVPSLAENFAAHSISPSEEVPSLETRNSGDIAHREAVSGEIGAEDVVDLALEALQRAILQKIREISEKMRDEQDLGRLKSQLECVEEALKVLGHLRN